MAHVFIVDDDPDFGYSLERIVRRMSHTASRCLSLGECRASMRPENVDVIFLDVMLPDGNGLDLLAELNELDNSPEVIIITGAGGAQGAEIAITNGAWDYISKLASVKEITLSLKRALQYRQGKLAAREASVTTSLRRDAIIGSSPAVTRCLDKLAQCADSDVNVILTGETGTGKELFARAIHENSARRDGPFVVVDCASLSQSLAESILFGHMRGAFTGAESNHTGLVIDADGGTLFLDEIGELPLDTQASFLRVLQERSIRPLGAKKEVRCDFRLVAATNRDLEEMVRNQHFRRDLYFRLQSYQLHLAPLRERAEDIDALATFHINQLCDRHGLQRKGISRACLESLCGYDWPGNIREMVNCLEQALITAGSEATLYPKHLPSAIRIHAKKAVFSDLGAEAAEPEPLTFDIADITAKTMQQFRKEATESAERQYLQALMRQVSGNLTEALRLSGLSQSRLYALLKKYGLRVSR